MSKSLLAAVLLVAFNNIFGQTDTLISSVISSFNDGSILYRIQYEEKDSVHSLKRNDVYRFNYYSNTDSLFLPDYNHVPPPPMDWDYNHIISLVFLKNTPENPVFIASNFCVESCYSINTKYSQTPLDWNIVGDIEPKLFTEGISENVYLFAGGMLFKSTDGGNTWPDLKDTVNTIFPFTPLALAPDTNFFMIGYDRNGYLVASNDFGKTVFVIDNNSTWDDNCKIVFVPGKERFYYAYDFNGTNNYNTLYRKSLATNTETLEEIISSHYPILFTLLGDSTNTLVYSKNYKIFSSSDSGNTSTLLFEPEILPNQLYDFNGKLGLTYPNRIVMYDGEKTGVLKKDITHALNFLPLQTGNIWKYHLHSESFDITDPDVNDYYDYFKVLADTVIDGRHYFEIHSGIAESPFVFQFLRVDSLKGIVYGLSPYFIGEKIALYLLPLESPLNLEEVLGIVYESNLDFVDLFGEPRQRMTYIVWSLFVMEQQFVENIGITHRYATFDFGFQTMDLLGCVIDGELYGDTTTVAVNDKNLSASDFHLSQNYPNPFNPATVIKYSVPSVGMHPGKLRASQLVTLKIYDILGREIATLVNEEQAPGNYQVIFDATSAGGNLSSGVYFYRLQAGGFVATKKMVLLR